MSLLAVAGILIGLLLLVIGMRSEDKRKDKEFEEFQMEIWKRHIDDEKRKR